MKISTRGTLVALGAMGVAVGLLLPQAASTGPSNGGNKVLKRELAIELGQAKRAKYQMPLSSGAVYTMLQASGALDARVASVPRQQTKTIGCSGGLTGVGPPNTRVNQDCSLRRQAEEVVKENPTNPNNLIAGQNDSRIGFNHCGYDWSFDGGKTWGDQVPPFWQFLLLDGRTADACSDPTVAFDADGNAYVGGIIFNVFDASNALVVAKSNAGIGGAFYHTPAALSFQTSRNVPLGVIDSVDDPNIFLDKEFLEADAWPSSPKKNNVYMTYTRFDFNEGAGLFQNSPIYFSQSTNGGATWSTGIEISGSNATYCTDFSNTVGDPDACDQDQGSHPVVGPDGTVYVVFGNGNTPILGVNQVLFVKCAGTDDCTDPDNWSDPVKIDDLIGTHPLGPSAAGCPFGRACLPPNGYRAPEFTGMTASVDGSGKLYVTWWDTRNIGANCDFDGGTIGSAATATPPCDTDVFYSYSTNGGATWSAAKKLTTAGNAQWQSWSDVRSDGMALYVAYYDRKYGSCEFTGCNDITLTRIVNPATATPTITHRRITTGSMPNLTLATNPIQAGFLGDYMWVDVGKSGRVHIVWADTRGLGGTVEEDIYYQSVPN